MAGLLTRISKAGLSLSSPDEFLISSGKIKAKASFLEKERPETFRKKFLFS